MSESSFVIMKSEKLQRLCNRAIRGGPEQIAHERQERLAEVQAQTRAYNANPGFPFKFFRKLFGIKPVPIPTRYPTPHKSSSIYDIDFEYYSFRAFEREIEALVSLARRLLLSAEHVEEVHVSTVDLEKIHNLSTWAKEPLKIDAPYRKDAAS